MFDDLPALVEFARAGSIAGAADRLCRTPSAITRQLQRLEDVLGAELLDRVLNELLAKFFVAQIAWNRDRFAPGLLD